MASSPSNITHSRDQPDFKIACVYALSGAYGPLPRFLYYVTFLFAIFGRNKEWLVLGALVSSLAYAATTAVHVMALCTSKRGVFDLDAIGGWAILSTAAVSYVAMIHWSSTLRNSKARIVMVIWGMLIGAGLVFNRATLYDQQYKDYESACYASDGMLLTSPLDLIKPDFNCTYNCFNISKPMRGRNEIIAVPASVIDNRYSQISYGLVGPIMFAAYIAISWDSQQHTPSQACTWLVMKWLKPQHEDKIVKLILDSSKETWYGGYIVLFHFIRRSPWGIRKAVLCFLAYPWMMLGLVLDIFCLPLLVANVAINELHLLGSGLPMNEALYNVGQWSPVVNSALVVIAAIIGKVLEVMEERKAKKSKVQLQQAECPNQLHRVDTDATLVEEIQVRSKSRAKKVARRLSESCQDRPEDPGRVESGSVWV